ncbi:MAG: rhodanese-like domain-containing protein [Anaerolineae bacterium]|nr:rhodanese-like domain-containing protein [Anaerolineae bacterium]
MRTIRWFFPALLVLIAVAAGCGSAAPQSADLPRLISPQDAAARLAADEHTVLLDVRTPEEWANDGRSPDAILIPLQELEVRVNELNKNDTIIVICRSGNRSQPAAEFLRQQGFSRVTEVEGGMRAWASQGLPIECDVATCALAP